MGNNILIDLLVDLIQQFFVTFNRTSRQLDDAPLAAGCRPFRGQWALARLGSLKYRGDPLPPADAHCHQRVALAGSGQFINRLHRIDGAGGADRMAK
jgi:hypothetical protein